MSVLAGPAPHRVVAARRGVLPAVLGVLSVALQIAYPLVHGDVRDRLTVAVVLALAATSLAHAAVTRGVRFAVLLAAATAVPGFVVEVFGVHTGVPFGGYSYGTTLGPALFGVPLVVSLAWTMLAWPAALAARRLVARPVARVLVGAWALASADVFLDPQLVAAGQWRWHDPSPHLPGVDTVPLTNFAGWMLVALGMSAVLQALLRRRGPACAHDGVGLAVYLWLYAGWLVALAVFLDLPAAAGWGALGMGLVAVPLAWRLVPPARTRSGDRSGRPARS